MAKPSVFISIEEEVIGYNDAVVYLQWLGLIEVPNIPLVEETEEIENRETKFDIETTRASRRKKEVFSNRRKAIRLDAMLRRNPKALQKLLEEYGRKYGEKS